MNIKLLGKIIAKEGIIQQSIVAIEELAELQQEISKCVRLRDMGEYESLGDSQNLMEKIADVMICIEQIKIMYGLFDGNIEAWIDSKLDRLEERYL